MRCLHRGSWSIRTDEPRLKLECFEPWWYGLMKGVNVGDGIPSGVKMGVGYEGHVMFC